MTKASPRSAADRFPNAQSVGHLKRADAVPAAYGLTVFNSLTCPKIVMAGPLDTGSNAVPSDLADLMRVLYEKFKAYPIGYFHIDIAELRTSRGHDQEQYPLPDTLELVAAGWPKKRDRLARAVLAVTLKHGGADLADGSTVGRSSLARREYHHLFPAAYLRNKGVPDEEIYLSLNCALVTWHTNRNISSKEPERYLAERRDGTKLGEAEVRRRLASHLIPYDEMVAGDYNSFLLRRAELVHAAMMQVCATGTTQADV